MSSVRNITIHIVKLVAVVLVVGIHVTNPLEEFGEYLNNFFQQGIARIAVPFFFAVSGYYLYANISSKGPYYFKKYVKRIILIAAVWGLVYMICYVPDKIVLDQQNWIKVIKIIWTYLFGYYHLWYLTALVIGAFGICYVATHRLLNSNLFLILCGTLYLIGCFFNVYDVYVENDLFLKIESGITLLLGNPGRNGLFYGFPMMILGALIFKHTQSVSMRRMQIGLIVSSLILLAEMVLATNIKQTIDMYVFMPLFLFFLVSYLMTDPLKTTLANSSCFLITTDISLGVYLIHLLIIKQLIPHLNTPGGILEYLAVIIISFSFVIVVKKVFKNTPISTYF